MPRRPPLALLLVLLAGCTAEDDAVPVPTPTATPTGCAAMVVDLPDELPQGVKRRETIPASTSSAAWGDPPIKLRCGVPAGLETDEPFSFNTVLWAMHDDGDTRRWTTRELKVNVEVVVPDAYSNQAELLGSLSTALLDNLG